VLEKKRDLIDALEIAESRVSLKPPYFLLPKMMARQVGEAKLVFGRKALTAFVST
jgi:hypothetical protein